MASCKPLGEYAWIVDRIRQYEKELTSVTEKRDALEVAIDRAIDDMPEGFVLRPFLEAHRAEVKGMLLTEYREAEAMELFREEGKAEGKVEGLRLLGTLITRLLELGRNDDVARVARDADYRDQLIAEFGLS